MTLVLAAFLFQSPSFASQHARDLNRVLDRAEEKASLQGKAVLMRGRMMILKSEMGLRGCWDYINGVYNQAGFPAKKRLTVFQSRKAGPYANTKEIRPGDWLYFVNHSYGGIEHSAIFVYWTNVRKHQALMLSYAGENRKAPARYKIYDLSNVYRIIRPQAMNIKARKKLR